MSSYQDIEYTSLNLPADLNEKAQRELNEPATIEERSKVISDFRERINALPVEERFK